MAYQAPRISISKDNVLRVHHPEVLEPSTYLTASVAAAGVTLTVKNNAGFANGDVLLIESFGAKGAEIKKVNGAVSAGSSITVSALTFAHGISARVSKILFDKVEISGAATASGSKTVIATVDLNASGPHTDYIISSTTYAYYFARFYNSLDVSPFYGAYSDATSATDYDAKNVGFIRRLAFENVDQEFEGKYAQDTNWVYDNIYLCEVETLKVKDHWSELASLNYDMGNVSTGVAYAALPSDIQDQNTGKSILGLRIGKRENMVYVDDAEFTWANENVGHTTLSVGVSVSDTTVTLTDSRDFDDSGSINIAGTEYSYTSNNRSTGVLSGFTAFSGTIASGTDVWQGVTFGEPRRFTVRSGYVYFDTPPSSDFNGRNIWISYIRGAQRPDSDGDSVLFAGYPLLYIAWLQMAIKKRKNGGVLPVGDEAVVAYEKEAAKFATRDRNQIGVRLVPDIPTTRNRRPYGFLR